MDEMKLSRKGYCMYSSFFLFLFWQLSVHVCSCLFPFFLSLYYYSPEILRFPFRISRRHCKLGSKPKGLGRSGRTGTALILSAVDGG